MASLVGSLYVSLEANFSAYGRGMKQAEAITTSTTAAIRRSAGATERSVTAMQRSMGSGIRPSALIAAGRSFDSAASRANLLRGSVFALTAAFGGLGAALTTNVVARYFDTFTGLENQVRVVSDGAADLAAQLSQIGAVANRSRSSLSAVAVLYSRLAKADPGQGAVRTLQRVETVNKALQLGGATAQEAASAAIQFSQAVASNRLGGEELRAVLETPLGLELAKGIGVTIGKFREMGYAGELTADVLYRALDKIQGSVDRQFAGSIQTIDQALTVADNKITAFAGKLDDTYGVTRLLTSAIGGFADNLQMIVPLLGYVGAGLGTLFAARRIGGLANTLGAPLAAIREIVSARKESLSTAKQELAVAFEQRNAAAKQLEMAKRTAAGGGVGLADRNSVRTYEKDLSQLMRTQREYTRNIQQQANLDAQIASMNSRSVAGIKARETALAKYNGLVGREVVLTQQLAKQREALDRSRSAMGASGAANAARGIEAAQQAANMGAAGYARAAAGMAEIEKRAGFVQTSLRAVGGAGMSLVNFLGGPWGVALTAAAGALTFFGMRAAAAAENARQAAQIINQELGRLSASGATLGTDDKLAMISEQILAESSRVETLTTRLDAIREKISSTVTDVLNRQINNLYDANAGEAAERLYKSMQLVTEEIRNGDLAIGDLYDRLRQLGNSEAVVAQLRSEIGDMVLEGRSAEQVLKYIKQRLVELDGQRATLEVKVNVDDPLGLLGTDFSDKKMMVGPRAGSFNNQLNPLDRLQGAPPAFDRMSADNFKKETLARASKDHTQRLKDETEELFNQGRALGLTYDEAGKLASEKIRLEDATKKSGSAAKSAAKDYENFANKLAELKERAAGSAAGLSDIDQQVLGFAERLKNGSDMMRRYIEAIKSGDLSKAPKELLEARDAFLQIGASKTADDIITQYGKGAQLAGRFAEMQELLNIAVARGDITAQQASVAFGDFVGQFGEYQWINDLSSALTSFAESAITDFDNIEDAAMSLLKQIGKIILQATVLGPLEQSLRGIFASSATGSSFGSSGGGGGGFLGSLLGGIGSLFGGGGSLFPSAPIGLYHEGGGAGTSKDTRTVSMANFANAARYHTGNIRSDEIAAILKQGETVLRKADSNKFFESYGRMGAYVRESHGMGGAGAVEIYLSEGLEARIIEQGTENTVRIIKEYDKTTLPGSVQRIRSDPYER